MRERRCVLLVLLVVASTRALASDGPPESLTIRSGDATLSRLALATRRTRPVSGCLDQPRQRPHARTTGVARPYEQRPRLSARCSSRRGNVCLLVFRRGVGLSSDVGKNAIDLMDGALARDSQEARDTLQLQLLEHREVGDAAAALAALRARSDVDSRRVS
jgi:hypothetical protein